MLEAFAAFFLSFFNSAFAIFLTLFAISFVDDSRLRFKAVLGSFSLSKFSVRLMAPSAAALFTAFPAARPTSLFANFIAAGPRVFAPLDTRRPSQLKIKTNQMKLYNF